MRSGEWLEAGGLDGFLHRSMLKAWGYADETFRGRPVVGICNTWSRLVNCNGHLRELAAAVERGVLEAGGFPVEFPVSSLGEVLMKPTAMLYRNLMAMDVEESVRAYPLDSVVLLSGCDKTTPACLMGAASANVPAISVTGGPMLSGHWRGRTLGSCTDCRRSYAELRAGRMTEEEFAEVENAIARSFGHCMTMGTASTMACVVEALGLTLPGGAAIPAADARRLALAAAAGRRAVALAREELRPERILTPESFDNAIRVLHAVGGSTNGIIHLLALAGRAGVDLPLRRFDELARDTPWLVNLKPAGELLMEDFHRAGGVPAVLSQLAELELVHLDAPTVYGTLRDGLGPTLDERVIAPAARPLGGGGSLAVLTGSLAPDGAVLKTAAASPELLRHEGRAVVFDDVADLHARVDDPQLAVDASSVLVLRNAGPVGAPGMPESGFLPIPRRLLEAGVRDMVRLSDARMSGTAFGTVVLHVAPESAVGGPLALVRSGDRVRLDVDARRLDLLVEERELAARRAAWRPPERQDARGYVGLHLDHVLQANEGCDLDFLRGRSPEVRKARTHG